MPRERAAEVLEAARGPRRERGGQPRALRGAARLGLDLQRPARLLAELGVTYVTQAEYDDGGAESTDRAVRDGIRCMLMRGGTSKGAYFLADDLPADPAERDDLMLRIMGTPDPRQIDGIGGAHPLTSKVAIVSASRDPDVDVDYLFLQVGVDKPIVSDAQTCGNLLAGVGPFAVERGLVAAGGDEHHRAHPPGQHRRRRDRDVPDPRGRASTTTATPRSTACPARPPRSSSSSAADRKPLLPTGNVVDELDGHRVTLIDNGMPVVLLRADEFGVSGDETPAELEANAELAARRRAGPTAGRAADGTRRRVGTDRAEDDPALAAAPRGRDLDARVHPRARAHVDRRADGGVRGRRRCIPGAVGADIARSRWTAPIAIEHPSGTFHARCARPRTPRAVARHLASRCAPPASSSRRRLPATRR